MNLPTAQRLYRTCEATWPPARAWRAGPWTIRDGKGGGKRVSAATMEGPAEPHDIGTARRAMEEIGQPPVFMLRDGEAALDAMLADAGFELIDPVTLYAAPVAALTAPLPRLAAFALDEPLAIMSEIWAEGGIGPARLEVMRRAGVPRTTLMARLGDRPAGVAYVGCDGDVAMIHAIEVRPAFRRQGVGRTLIAAAANWTAGQGAGHLSLVVLTANTAANALYASLGMAHVGQYHYRIEKGRTRR